MVSADMPMSAIVGRGAELDAIDGFLDRLAGEAGAIVFEGEARIGKTTVWRQVFALRRIGNRCVGVAAVLSRQDHGAVDPLALHGAFAGRVERVHGWSRALPCRCPTRC